MRSFDAEMTVPRMPPKVTVTADGSIPKLAPWTITRSPARAGLGVKLVTIGSCCDPMTLPVSRAPPSESHPDSSVTSTIPEVSLSKSLCTLSSSHPSVCGPDRKEVARLKDKAEGRRRAELVPSSGSIILGRDLKREEHGANRGSAVHHLRIVVYVIWGIAQSAPPGR